MPQKKEHHNFVNTPNAEKISFYKIHSVVYAKFVHLKFITQKGASVLCSMLKSIGFSFATTATQKPIMTEDGLVSMAYCQSQRGSWQRN
jgi:hypothetical protein